MAKTKKAAVKKPAAKKAATKKAAAKKAPAKQKKDPPAEVVRPSADGPSLARVPDDQRRKPAVEYKRDEIHPDVTSLGGPKAILTNGIAKMEDLAPGQSLEPSPPHSSSNILPQEENPSFG